MAEEDGEQQLRLTPRERKMTVSTNSNWDGNARTIAFDDVLPAVQAAVASGTRTFTDREIAELTGPHNLTPARLRHARLALERAGYLRRVGSKRYSTGDRRRVVTQFELVA